MLLHLLDRATYAPANTALPYAPAKRTRELRISEPPRPCESDQSSQTETTLHLFVCQVLPPELKWTDSASSSTPLFKNADRIVLESNSKQSGGPPGGGR